jgi:hypothetical protein
MLTLYEAPTFSAQWPDYWSPEEFGAWLAVHPDAGDVIPQSNGCRKVRWSVPGRGKRGGARVIYFNRLEEGHIWLLMMYAKNARSTVDGRIVARLRETIDAKDD